MSATTTPAFDLDGALPARSRRRDAAGQAALYAPDAVLTTIDATTGPSDPAVLRGRDAIGAMLDEVCARDMTHEVVFARPVRRAGGDRRRVPLRGRRARALLGDARAPRRADRRADDRAGLGRLTR